MGHFALRHGLERKPVLGLRAVEGGYTWHGLSRPWKLQVPFFHFSSWRCWFACCFCLVVPDLIVERG